MYPDSSDKFTASNGWLNRFLNRNDIRFRAVTSLGQKLPPDSKDLSLHLLDYVDKEFRQSSGYRADSRIYNMDEMPIYFDSPNKKTYEFKGKDSVIVKTTGHEKTRFTLVLCASNDGQKVMPAIIFGGLKKVPKPKKNEKQFMHGIHIMVAKKASMDEPTMIDWVRQVFAKRPGGLFLNMSSKSRIGVPKHKTCLVMDSQGPHKVTEVLKLLSDRCDTFTAIIPGGLTPIIQPADVSWNKLVKSRIKHFWRDWMDEPKTEADFTPDGNLKKPSYALVAEWCLTAWNEIPIQQIKDSFKQCGLGPERGEDSELNHKLLEIITKGEEADLSLNEEPTGISDTESVDEEFYNFFRLDKSYIFIVIKLIYICIY